MGDRTSIEWTRGDDGSAGATWNPIRGTVGRWACTRVSPGCDACYAARLNVRFGGPDYAQPGQPLNDTLRFDEKALLQPLSWRAPRRIFVCSMTDLFHENVSELWLDRIFGVMALARQHTFMLLTKRPKRMKDYVGQEWGGGVIATRRRVCEQMAATRNAWRLDRRSAAFDEIEWDWPLPNVWLGVSIELDRYSWRANLLRETPAAVRFISAEPLLGHLDSLDLTGIDWLIAGSESGTGARPMDDDWVRGLRDACQRSETKFFFKQRTVGGKKIGMPELDGVTWAEFPGTTSSPSESSSPLFGAANGRSMTRGASGEPASALA
jgi:protein gp37